MEGVPLKKLLKATSKVIGSLPNPMQRTEAGRPRFDYKSRITALIVKAWLKKGYRDTEVYLSDNKQTLTEFHLRVPDHNTIWRTMISLSEPYLKVTEPAGSSVFKKEKNA
jgi:hypothetical protein